MQLINGKNICFACNMSIAETLTESDFWMSVWYTPKNNPEKVYHIKDIFNVYFPFMCF